MYAYKCACGHRAELPRDAPAPTHCGAQMKRDYRAESPTATFKGDGWARQNP